MILQGLRHPIGMRLIICFIIAIFKNTIPYDNVYERLTYEGFACARPSGQNMEEFLIGVNKNSLFPLV